MVSNETLTFIFLQLQLEDQLNWTNWSFPYKFYQLKLIIWPFFSEGNFEFNVSLGFRIGFSWHLKKTANLRTGLTHIVELVRSYRNLTIFWNSGPVFLKCIWNSGNGEFLGFQKNLRFFRNFWKSIWFTRWPKKMARNFRKSSVFYNFARARRYVLKIWKCTLKR